ncbi:hypothetical protein PMAYCL1PPCAC_32462 [Pristionchus mayeri]|uniref:Nuclear receptor n=1 Tax=Pristionchus mayeri TaxID=1317129 RepID=A0AAN5DGU5_9BILA|nr:hypothetical protein PMAYCL1PPCAC_32462 [Pristionchus mayeri]
MPESAAKPPRKCLVCSVPVHGATLGMDCCRACATFFKRAKLAGKKFACRAGDRKCKIVNDDKFTCRRCRFDRCVAVGLTYDGPLRVNKKPIREDVETPPSTSSDDASTSTSCSTSRLNAQPESSTSRLPERILERIGREYNASVERRRVQEARILEQCDEKKLAPHLTQTIYLANYESSLLMHNICVAETLIFFRQAFPSLASLSDRDRDVLFKSYIGKFSTIDSNFRTRKVWGELKRFVMGGVLVCIDLESTDRWLGDGKGGENRQSLLESMRWHTNSHLALIRPIFEKAQITNKEFYALLALLLCEIDSSADLGDHVFGVVDEIQKEVLEDLQRYYNEEMGLSDFSTRLGNLMTLSHSARECNSLSQECLRLLTTVFDLYRSEELIMELFI